MTLYKYLALALFFLSNAVNAQRLPALIPYHCNQKWGYADSTGKVIVPCRFDAASLFYNSDSVQLHFDNKQVWMRKDGSFGKTDTIVPVNWGSVTLIPGALPYTYMWSPMAYPAKFPIRTQNNAGKWGFTNNRNDTIIPCRYALVMDFSDGLALVKENDTSFGYINKQGRYVLHFKEQGLFENLGSFSYGFARRGTGLIDKKGKWVVPGIYNDPPEVWNKNLILLKDEGRFTFITAGGRPLDGNIYLNLDDNTFSDQRRSVMMFEPGSDVQKYGFIDTAGHLVIPCQFDGVDNFHETYCTVRKGFTYGFINRQGHYIDTNRYEEAGWFSHGLAAVEKDGKWGYIDYSGKIIIPFTYREAGAFDAWGLAAVREEGQFFLIDRKGKRLSESEYDRAPEFDDTGLAYVSRHGYWFYIDRHGREYLFIPQD